MIVADAEGARAAEGVASTIVHFADISDAEIDAYVATGELWVAAPFLWTGWAGLRRGHRGRPPQRRGVVAAGARAALLLELGVDWTNCGGRHRLMRRRNTDRVG